MLLRYLYDERLAHASYLLGCQKTGEAIVIDPGRDVTPCLRAARAEGLRVVAAAETHIHADYVSGAREWGVRHGVKLYLSGEGDEYGKYHYVDQVDHQLLADGDRFSVGHLLFTVMHTPGHTPESISFLLTDRGGKADKPMGMFTGDFVFVGDVGRPDLLEKAVGLSGTAEQGARAMYRSLQRFKALPDYLQVWPSHGAGSACGKALGAVPSSTVGYEKLYNWALQCDDEEAFVRALLDGQPEPPPYFAVMKRVNREGPALLDQLPEPRAVAAEELPVLLAGGARVLDTRPSQSFAGGHIRGTLNIPYNKSFTTWAGWLVDDTRPLYLIAAPEDLSGILSALRSIGIDNVAGWTDVRQVRERAELDRYPEAAPAAIADEVMKREVLVLDVRNQDEWDDGHIPGALHIMLGTLPRRLAEIPAEKPILVQCRSGARSAIAASILKAHGFSHVINLSGGYLQWKKEGRPLVRPNPGN
jgi:hydroxyacylglutathione hydrolase